MRFVVILSSIALFVAENKVVALQPFHKTCVSNPLLHQELEPAAIMGRIVKLNLLPENSIATKAFTVVSSLMFFSAILFPTPAWSQVDIAKGETLFQANCAGCHAGGNNYVSEKRTLRKDAIQQYRGSTDQSTIINFVQNGMPHKLLPMKSPMNDKDYSDVVAYVLDQALGEKW
jgi:cytochrome c6